MRRKKKRINIPPRRSGCSLQSREERGSGLVLGLGLGEAPGLVTVMETAFLLEFVNAFVAFQDIALFADRAFGTQTGMDGHGIYLVC